MNKGRKKKKRESKISLLILGQMRINLWLDEAKNGNKYGKENRKQARNTVTTRLLILKESCSLEAFDFIWYYKNYLRFLPRFKRFKVYNNSDSFLSRTYSRPQY